jgi:hypothetical protein
VNYCFASSAEPSEVFFDPCELRRPFLLTLDRMSEPIVVNQSTSVVQVDTSTVVYPNSAVVLLSSITAPGTIITIRDITGYASTNRGIAVSTTAGVHYLDGPGCNVYNINQPYGFLTVTPRTSNVWAVINTFAFPDQAAHPSVEGIDARQGNFSNLSGNTGSFNNLTVFYSTFMNVATVSSVLARSISTQSIAVSSNISAVNISTSLARFSTVTINNPLTPSTSLDVNGSIRASTIFLTNSAYVRGSLIYNTNNIVSTVQGLGTATYISSPSLASTVRGLGTATYISSPSLVSTVQGLGTATYISSGSLVSTVEGLGTATYISSSSLVSTVEGLGSAGYLSSPVTGLISSIIGLGSSGFVSTTMMASTVIGLGSSQYVSSTGLFSTVQGLGSSQYVSAATMASTVIGLGTATYVSTTSLISTVQGLGTAGYVSSASFVSTVQGLGTATYISSPSLVSTVQGLGTATYLSSASLVSTVQGLGTATYISSASIASTVRGLGSSGYISTPNVLISSLSTHSLVVYGPSTFINASNLFIGASISTNTLRFLGTYKDGFDEPTQYTTTVIAERIYDEGLLTEESSELLLFKGNDGTLPLTYAPGPDRVRVLAAGGFQVDIASNGGIWPVGGQPPSTVLKAFTINCNGYVGIGCNTPSYTLDVAGTINACNIGINGSLLVTTSNLISTVKGVGTAGYVSSTGLFSTVQGLGSSQYISSTGLASTVEGLGTAGYLSSIGTALASTVQGLGTASYVSSAHLASTVQGLGTASYVSSAHLASTVQGLGTASYVSSPSLVSTVQGLGTSSYISSASLASTVQGLGSSGYISSPDVLISSLSTHSLVVYGPSTFINASNIFIGASVSTNVLRFLGTYKDGYDEPVQYTTTVIGERIYDDGLLAEQSSELLLFKGNDGTLPTQYAPGPDRVRILAAGGFQVDIASNGGTWPIGGQPPTTAIQAFYIGCNGRVGINCNSPSYTLDVQGSINVSGTINAFGFVNSDNLTSTVQGLGSSQYISSTGLVSTVQGLGSSSYVSSTSLASTVEGLGTAGYISSASFISTVQGLGSSSYISSPSLVSTVEGLGTASYVSTASLVSTVQGLGTASYVSTASLVSTVEGLGTSSYISSPSLVSTVQGLGTASYISSPSLVSTVQGLGTSSYISSGSLVSTVQGLGTAGYISSPDVSISSLSTYSLTVYGPSTFINASNLFIGASVSTNVLRFLGTYKDGYDEPVQYTTTVIGERIYDDGLLAEQSSELLLFKGNDGTLPTQYAPGPDRVRILAAGGFQVDIASNGGSWPVGGQPPTTALQAFYIGCNGRVGINCNSPSYTLDVQGSINVSGTINAFGFVNSDNLASTVQGLGTVSYISSTGLASTVQGLGSSQYVSSSSLVSTVQGLGSSSYMSSSSLVSTVQGLGQIFLSSPVIGLVSTVQGLGSSSYISSSALVSTVQGLGQIFLSSPVTGLVSSIQGLGSSQYVSSTGLASTVQGLGSSRYISSPIVTLSTLSTQSLIAFGESTFLFSSNVYIGNSLSTNILRFYGTTAYNSYGVNQYARTVIAERSFSNDTSELLLFKANNALGIPGPDNVRVLAAGGFQVDIATNGGVWPINGNPPSTTIRAFTVSSNGNVGIGCNSPRSTLDVNGIVNVSCNIFVNGLPVVTSGIDTDSNYISTSNLLIGAGPSTNTLRFLGTRLDGFNEGNARKFTHSVIGERIYDTEELSELLIFKGDNTGCNSWGPDRVRVLSAGGFVVDISPEGCNWPVNSEPPPAAISNAFSIGRDGVIRTASTILINGSRVVTSGGGGGSTSFASNVGINCNFPEYTLDVDGIINSSCNIFVNGNPVVTSGGAGGAIVLSCNVGINCNAPGYTLDVNGCLNVSGCNVATYQWIALGAGVDKILKSSDGYEWSPVTGDTFTTSGSRVAWNGSNKWIAVGTGANTILSSTNGNAWTAVSGPTFTAGNDVVWNGTNLWVAVGGGTAANSIWRSADGTTWTASSTGFSAGGFGIATSGAYWVAVGNGGSAAANQKFSGDGITWSNSSSVGFSSSGRGVAFNGINMWVAVGNGSSAANTILYSTSGGQLWSNAVTGGFSGGGTSVAWNGSLWVATGSHSSAAGNIQISLDGMNWLPSLTGAFSGSASGVVWSGTKFIATGTGTSPILYSDDGRNWSSSNVSNATFTAGLGIGYGRTLTGPLYALTVSGDTYINGALYINGVPAGAAVSGSGGSAGGTSGGGGGTSLPINIELVSSILGIFGRVGVGCNSPSYTMDVNGSINASSNIFINGSPLLAASSLYSTVRGLGSIGYVSTTQMNALINNTFVSSIQGLGSYGYISSLSNLSNITNVNSLQGVFSSIGVNCNLPAYNMDVNGSINASANIFINGSALLPASSLYSTVTGLGTAGYVSSLVNVNSFQGVFSSIGVNCNLPAHRLDINGKLNVTGNPAFGLIQAQGTTSETVSFYLDPVNAGTPTNTGWITGQTTTTGIVGAAHITTFGVTRVNNSILSQYGYYMTSSNGRFGINTNNPSATLHVNGLDGTVPGLFVGGSNGFGLIQLQGGGVGYGQETGIYSKDCFVGGLDCNSGWYYGQSYLQGATLSNFIIRRVNAGGAGVSPAVQITPAGTTTFGGSIRAGPYITGGSFISSNGPSTRSEVVLWAGANGYFDWITTNNLSGVAGCGLQLLWYGAENIAVPNTLYSVNFCNATTTIPGTIDTNYLVAQNNLFVAGRGQINQGLLINGNQGPHVTNIFGNVGINVPNSNPDYPLDVSGSIQVRIVNNNFIRLMNTGAENMPSIAFSSNSSTAAIGYNAPTNTITYGYGTNAAGVFLATVTATGYVTSSDKILKENIVDARTNYLDDLNKLRLVNYNRIGKTKKELGFIAQEMEEVFPSVVEKNGYDDTKGYAITALIPMLVSAVQSLSKTVSSLQGQIDEIKSANNPPITPS